ncbi:MAG: MobF family relaxase [Gemmataceae bacterium]
MARMAAGQHEYYTGLAGADDYHLSGQELPGTWWGKGALARGLEGTVRPRDLKRLFEGYSPDGSKLVQNAGKENRSPGSDAVFSPPKTVDAVWSQGDGHVKRHVEEAHAAAVTKALSEFETRWAFCRVGKDGLRDEHAKLVVALFQHSTNRNQDPKLHTHCLILNVAVTADGATHALDNSHLYRAKMLLGALYRCELAHQLERRLGLETHRVKSWFEVSHVPESLCEKFSSRREEIIEHLQSRGLESATAASCATLATRQRKESLPREELFAAWRAEGEAHGFGAAQVHALTGPVPFRDHAAEFQLAFRDAVERLSASHSHFSERDLLRAVAEESQCRGLSADEVVTRLGAELELNHEIVSLGVRDAEARYATRETLALERKLLAAADRSRDDGSHVACGRTVEAVLSRRTTMSDEQVVALRHLTTREGSVQCLTGMAGTGKSFLMDAARQVWELEGYRVLGCALAGKAARGLEEGAGIKSTTIHKVVWDLDHGKLSFGRGDVLVVDEAGTVPTRLMERLVREVTAAGGKLVLVGDARQLQPIEAGGPFRAVCDRLGDATLTRIIRQKEEWAREAVHEFARGEADKGLKRYAERGLLHVAKDRADAMRELVKAYGDDGLSPRRVKEKLILAGTNYEAAALNNLVQEARLRKGELGPGATRVEGASVRDGDRVVFTKRSTVLGIENGSFATALSSSALDNTLTVRLDSGKVVVVPLAHYASVRLGYAVTDFKAQGATVERAYVLTGGQMTHREASYVEASRAREKTLLFTDRHEAGEKLEQLARQMSKSRAKDLAHDVMKSQEPELRLQL